METNAEKYSWQQNQDEELQKKFYDLHHKLVDEVISFCKENNLVIDNFRLGADFVQGSIEFGKWCPCTDSSFVIDREIATELGKPFNEITNEEFDNFKKNHKPFLYSI